MDDSARKRENADSFGAVADAYRESEIHRDGADLDLLAEWCRDATRALDVACGAGHTAGALAARRAASARSGDELPTVIAADVSPEMVATATEAFPVAGAVADAERLPFESDAFDAVTCRIAAHHFPDPRSFVREVARVLEPGGERVGGARASSDGRSDGGVFAFEDCVAPEDDDLAAFLNRFERTRDPSHVEMHPRSRWESWFRAAGFEIEEVVTMEREMDYAAWVGRTDPSVERRETLAELVRTPEAEEVYGVRFDGSEVRSFHNRKALIRATLPE